MKITIQAMFPEGEEARLAASALAMAQGGGLDLSISTHEPGVGAFERSPFLAALGRSAPSTGSGGTLVTVTCSPEQEAFVMGELAALGARRVVQQNDG